MLILKLAASAHTTSFLSVQSLICPRIELAPTAKQQLIVFSVVFSSLWGFAYFDGKKCYLIPGFYLKLTAKSFSMIPIFKIERLFLLYSYFPVHQYSRIYKITCLALCYTFLFYNSNYGIHLVVCVISMMPEPPSQLTVIWSDVHSSNLPVFLYQSLWKQAA